jgi:bifunctional UDP-N-acetylglucosamine pyrophosphorylase/glucosamine-1-phosphate N-acetyltransferase
VETKAPGDATPEEEAIREVNTGIYAFAGGDLVEALRSLRADNAQGELYLPDVLPHLRADGKAVGAHVVTDPALTLGVNTRVELAHVRRLAQERIHRAHALAGVTIVDPASTLIDVGVEIGGDSVIEPGTFLRGTTRIGARCEIGPLTTLIDTTAGDEARIVHSYLHGAELGSGVSVGPFAYLRPQARLRDKAKAGTFVEIKNSEVGEGTKVPHLSYIGDADIGAGTNIGAGTITGNYDGVRKHRTTIGAGVKGGIHVSFVAPVKVGDGAYTGAGSVITDDVPDGALGIARERQTNLEGYADRRKER